MAIAAMLAGTAARGDDDRAVDDLPEGVRAAQEQQRQNLVDLGANFDANVFSAPENGLSLHHGRRRNVAADVDDTGNKNGGAEREPARPAALAAIRKAGEARIARIDEVCGLTEPQRRMLRLALDSDGRRAAAEIEATRGKYEGVEVNFGDQAGQRRFQEFQKDVQRCRELQQRLFDVDSLVAKALPGALDAEQYARLTAEREARAADRWRAVVAASMLQWDATLGLDQAQFDAMERLLIERRPRLRMEGAAGRTDPRGLHNLVMEAVAAIDDATWRKIVSERQWRTISEIAGQARALKQHIESQGFVERVDE
jgi:hypothetical protein